ncbi:MAG: hypothetical protein ACI4R7_07980 [Oliverpabstia sp.]
MKLMHPSSLTYKNVLRLSYDKELPGGIALRRSVAPNNRRDRLTNQAESRTLFIM